MISRFNQFSKDFISQLTDSWEIKLAKKISEDVNDKLQNIKAIEQGDYLFARLDIVKASGKILDVDLSYICGTDGLSNYFFIERNLLLDFIRENSMKRGKTCFENLSQSYATKINSYAKDYGYTKEMIVEKINKETFKLSAVAEM